MTLRRWDPFSELMSVRQALDRLMEEAFRPLRAWTAPTGEFLAPMDIYQRPDALVVKVDLPGVKPEDVEITIQGNTLSVRGEVKQEEEVKGEDYLVQERRYGSFVRSVTLPEGLAPDKAEASFENGVLTITIPKAEEAKPRTVRIKTK